MTNRPATMLARHPLAPKRPAFGRYAEWYDTFNRDKDYAAEVSEVLRIVAAAGVRPARWLDLGCGTGRHQSILEAYGIEVTGLDVSLDMLAEGKRARQGARFVSGSIEEIAFRARFDVVTMLFHVLNYLIDDDAVAASLQTIRNHLTPDGVFVFDFWHSPDVTRNPPERRVRYGVIDGRRLYRIAIPWEDRPHRIVRVTYAFRWDSPFGELAYEEDHWMRHYSCVEVANFLEAAGLRTGASFTWADRAASGTADWTRVMSARLR